MMLRPDLTIVVDHPDGAQTRWGRDEPNPTDIPGDLTFSTSMPGGFKDLACSLLRSLRTAGNERIFDQVRVLGPGGRTMWEGRLQQMARTSDAGGRIQPQAVGNQALLSDDPTFREIFVDRSVEGWGGIPSDRRSDILNVPNKPFDGSTAVAADGVGGYGPSLELSVPGYTWTSAAGRPFAEIWYDGRGLKVARMEWAQQSNVLAGTDLNWVFKTFSQAPAGDYSPDAAQWYGNGPGYFGWTVPNPRPWIAAHLYYDSAPAGSADVTWFVRLSRVAVVGTHGLPRYAMPGNTFETGSQPPGVRGSDVIAHALARCAPGVRFTTGPGGTITPTSTDDPIPHLTFFDPVSVAQVVATVNARHLWHWAVWENKTFWFHPPAARGRTWRLAEADGLQLQLEGDDAAVIYNALVVTFTDFTGRQRIVGPPGTPGTDFTDPRLFDASEENAATAHGLRRTDSLTLTFPTSPSQAASIGSIKLAEGRRATRRGTASWSGWVTDDAGTLHPAAQVRSGDQLIVTDRPGEPARRIIETTYALGTDTTTMTLDNTAPTLDALLERVSTGLIGVG